MTSPKKNRATASSGYGSIILDSVLHSKFFLAGYQSFFDVRKIPIHKRVVIDLSFYQIVYVVVPSSRPECSREGKRSQTALIGTKVLGIIQSNFQTILIELVLFGQMFVQGVQRRNSPACLGPFETVGAGVVPLENSESRLRILGFRVDRRAGGSEGVGIAFGPFP